MTIYVVRQALRTPVQYQFYCFASGTLITGMIWDLSATGWRATVDRPLPVGLETTVYITLREGQECHHLRVDSARVRWADGCHVGWEITATDEVTLTRLTDFLELCERETLLSGILEEPHPDLPCRPAYT